eukprot:2310640-Rhodomonas_salina.4
MSQLRVSFETEQEIWWEGKGGKKAEGREEGEYGRGRVREKKKERACERSDRLAESESERRGLGDTRRGEGKGREENKP